MLVAVMIVASLLANAGTITGKVTGVSGTSVVYINSVGGQTFPAPAKRALMGQKGMAFLPHVLAVQQGTTVDFVNGDKVAHNVFWPSISGNRSLEHNLGTWGYGETRSFIFTRPGVVPLLSNRDPKMAGFIVVSPTPSFATTDNSGNYKIANVLDGTYKLSVWHDGVKVQSKSVNGAGAATADFVLRK